MAWNLLRTLPPYFFKGLPKVTTKFDTCRNMTSSSQYSLARVPDIINTALLVGLYNLWGISQTQRRVPPIIRTPPSCVLRGRLELRSGRQPLPELDSSHSDCAIFHTAPSSIINLFLKNRWSSTSLILIPNNFALLIEKCSFVGHGSHLVGMQTLLP